jgi:hypothetical protein
MMQRTHFQFHQSCGMFKNIGDPTIKIDWNLPLVIDTTVTIKLLVLLFIQRVMRNPRS